jgi:predicted 2-oxoglutarate/Fe(II)-dependent dioxygenase YbiX
MIRDAYARSLIFDLDNAIQALLERARRSGDGQADRYLSQPDPRLG